MARRGGPNPMSDIQATDLGQAWFDLLHAVYRTGEPVGDGTRELRNVRVAFEECGCRDPRLARFAARQPVEEMRKVFFSSQANRFGHSYADKVRGPEGRRDLADAVDLLAREPWSKRAAVTLVGNGDGKVPCINTVHFLRREAGLFVSYFSRGQDVFKKFYADGVCIHEMGRRVGEPLGIPVALVTGMISSAHVYLADLPAIQGLLDEVEGTRRAMANLPRGGP